MKTISIFAVILFSFVTMNTQAQNASLTSQTIKVWGNCGMCKTTIEKAAKKAGTTSASWDEDSKELKVSFDTLKTSAQQIQMAIAKAGYDTQDLTGDNNAYKKLPACCKYERKAAAVFSCPMHPEITGKEAGKCSKCGMDLTAAKKEDHSGHHH
jgi:periplasmic mercuric ion binding protein